MSRGSSSSPAPAHAWPRYGPVPLTHCPECPRLDPMVRLTCKKRDTGNFGREFVKCESKPQPGRILKQCTFFMWMDAYVEKMQFEGMLTRSDCMDGPYLMDSENLTSPAPVVEGQGCSNAARSNGAVFFVDGVGAELKKLNASFSEIIDLKKKDLVISVAFYVCMVVIGLMLALKK